MFALHVLSYPYQLTIWLDWFVGHVISWWFLPQILSPVTNIQHHYLARYPIDDRYLPNVFMSVYFSEVMCMQGLYYYSYGYRLRWVFSSTNIAQSMMCTIVRLHNVWQRVFYTQAYCCLSLSSSCKIANRALTVMGERSRWVRKYYWVNTIGYPIPRTHGRDMGSLL